MNKKIWVLLLMCSFFGQANARTWFLEPDGTGDVPTLAAAIDSSVAGDIIELACGTYHEEGMYLKSGVIIRSASGHFECVTIEGRQPETTPGGIFIAHGVDATTLLEGLTISGGWATSNYFGFSGGGIAVFSSSELRVKHCLISGNFAKRGGGVEISNDSYPIFEDCIITGNESLLSAGGVSVISGRLRAEDTLIMLNSAGSGPADGLVGINGDVYFYCCDISMPDWQIDGDIEVDDSGCGQVGVEFKSWESVKAFYR